MTKKEFYNAVIAGTVSAEMVEFAQKELDTMNASSQKRALAAEAKNAEGFALIREYFSAKDGAQALTSEVAENVGMTTSKASALLRKMVENGELIAEDVKVSGKGTRKAYRIA